jgi:tRNA modification GTPase
VTPEVLTLLSSVKSSLAFALEGGRAAERVRSGFEVALIGAPNTGKSTLLNAIAGREVAITSDVAGTTRDVIEVAMDLGGMAVTMLDTAGLRDTDDVVEAIGVARARQRAEAADLRVLLDPDGDADQDLIGPCDLVVRSKADLSGNEGVLAVSARTGDGVAALLSAIESALAGRISHASELSRIRHRHAAEGAISNIESAEHVILTAGPLEIAAEELRGATSALESVIGRVDAERILDDIFSSFCLGK